jgi:hypothetical protein
MNWEAIGSIGEIIGATAVVLTLAYLAVQVRHGTKATQAASIHAASTLDQEFLLALGTDPVIAQLWTSYLTAPETLPHEQQIQGHYLMGSMLRRLENIYFQYHLGTLSQGAWQSRQMMFSGMANSKGYVAYLDSLPAAFLNDEFIDYMATQKSES